MVAANVLTATVSCATTLMLGHIIHDLLSVKTQELFLKNKTTELDREMSLIHTQEETGRHVRMLTHEIRNTLDRHTILKTTQKNFSIGRVCIVNADSKWSRASAFIHTALPKSYWIHRTYTTFSD